MGNKLKPGNMDIQNTSPPPATIDDMAGSMADTMDHELDRLLKAANLPGLSFDTTDRDVRGRRRLFVAIARGVVIHLQQNQAAFGIAVPAAVPANISPTIATDGV